jgi:hypothetical protein
VFIMLWSWRTVIGGQAIVRTIEPLLGEQKLRLVVQLVRDRNEPAVIERS